MNDILYQGAFTIPVYILIHLLSEGIGMKYGNGMMFRCVEWTLDNFWYSYIGYEQIDLSEIPYVFMPISFISKQSVMSEYLNPLFADPEPTVGKYLYKWFECSMFTNLAYVMVMGVCYLLI